jgi:hypothetical protein
MAIQSSVPRTMKFLALLLTLCANLSLLMPSGTIYGAPPQINPQNATVGAWEQVNNWGIFGKHMTLMHNGKVLVWPTGEDAFVWDPVTNIKTPVPALFGDLHCAAQTTLADGRVIVLGGVIVSPHDGITVTAIFDPNTNLWTQGTPMHYARWYPTSTTLADGRVLVTSGDMPGDIRADIPEIYDPVANTWTVMPNAVKDLGLYPNMFVLPNGRAFAAGTKTNTYLLDPNNVNATWSNGPTNAFGSSGYAESSAMYAPGKIIRSGGGDPSIANTAIVDMNVTPSSWTQISPMNFPRRRHNLVVLADGQVMAVGGTRDGDNLGDGITTGAVYEGEIWNPATGQWATTARMTHDRMYHSSALLLPDGRVLVAGGENAGRMNAQIFQPPYLFKGQRPTITSAPEVAPYGTNFNITVTTDGSAITNVGLIRAAAVTHAFDHNQRYVPLTFSANGNTLTVSGPASGGIAPPGYYMLVVKDNKGVPSIAKWVRVDSAANLQPGTIMGKVIDGAGSPISGATVSFSGGSTATDANGDYTLNDVLPGEQLVTVSKNGFASVSKSQIVVGGQSSSLNFTLTPPGTITGTITNSENGDPISGAIVTHSGGTATSDASGNYSIASIPSGSQTLIASAPGYNSSPEQTINVPANGSVTLNFVLEPKPTYIAGEVLDSWNSQPIPGATISAGSAVTTTDSLGRYQLFVPPGTYDVTVEKYGYTGETREAIVTFGTYTAADFALAPINPPITLTPIADAYTADAADATTNFGLASTLRVDSSPNKSVYLRFNVTGVSRPVQNAKLRLFVATNGGNGGGPLGGDVFATSNNYANTTTPWTETGLNWNNAPAITGTALASSGAVAENTWVEFDVTSAVTGNGTVVLGLKAMSTDEVRYTSKEGGTAPQLVIVQELPPPPPAISSFTPPSGPVGTEVTIHGSQFNNVSAVTFNGVAATDYTVGSPSVIYALVPNGAATGKIGVTTSAGAAASANDFVVTPPPAPTIGGFTPANGPVGAIITINGSHFINVASVKFNGVAASGVIVDSDTQIRVPVPAGATTGKISITTATGSATSANNFVVTVTAGPPSVSSFTPPSGPVGTAVTINGSNFINVTAVKFNGVSASSFTIESATQIRAVVPAGTSVGKISVVTGTGSAASATNFQVTTTALPKYRVFMPTLKTGPATAATSASAQYKAFGSTWQASSPFGYCTLY